MGRWGIIMQQNAAEEVWVTTTISKGWSMDRSVLCLHHHRIIDPRSMLHTHIQQQAWAPGRGERGRC
jgi:hypothetical protein